MAYKHTLKLQLFKVNKDSGSKELIEEKMTSPDAFFDHFEVHPKRMKNERVGDSLVVTEVVSEQPNYLMAVVTEAAGTNHTMLRVLFEKLNS